MELFMKIKHQHLGSVSFNRRHVSAFIRFSSCWPTCLSWGSGPIVEKVTRQEFCTYPAALDGWVRDVFQVAIGMHSVDGSALMMMYSPLPAVAVLAIRGCCWNQAVLSKSVYFSVPHRPVLYAYGRNPLFDSFSEP